MKPITNKGYKLLHDGCIALSQVEANGIKIDTKYVNKAIANTDRKIKRLTARMKEDKIFKLWRKQFGRKTNMGSGEQLGKILFSVLGFPCPARTKTKKPKVDVTTLSGIDLDFVRDFTQLGKLKKARTTYLQGILRETVDGFIHPFFNLNLVQTFRGSSDHPNFHNQPIKDPQIKKLVRRAFIARPNHRIVETDYSGAEICCATCYHKDPRMIAYIKDETKDLHRDMAMKCYMIPKEQVSWDARDTGKNMFVFPQFYGDYYIHCARSMWEALIHRHIKTTDGLSIIKHLKRMGIKSLGECDPDSDPLPGTFEKHVRGVEDKFWGEWFKVYGRWKEDWYYAYLKKGYFDTLTGFRIEGLYRRNEVINYPVQGSAFHWLLWSLIRIQKLLKKYKMRSLLVGQIHDSIVADVHKKEVRDYLSIVNQVMTIDVRKHWKWIIVPLSIEAEAAPVGGSWYEKEEVKI